MSSNLLKSLLKHRKDQKRPNWSQYSFKKQWEFITDPSDLKVALCTRRSGKTYSAGLYICKEAIDNPHTTYVYIAKTRSSAEAIFWHPVLKKLNRQLNLGIHFNDQKLMATFPNGSICYLVGTDSSYDDMTKLLGQAFRVAVIDEASKYTVANVHNLIFDILKPAMADYNGTIVMIGTPDNYVKSYFARVTQGLEPGWSIHGWTALDNPHMETQFQAEMDKLIENNPDVIHEAWFRQNYLKEWVVDTRALLYKSTPENVTQSLPKNVNDFTYSLGVVLSSKGYTAIAVMASSKSHRTAYVETAYKFENTDLYRAIEEINRIQRIYGDKLAFISCADASKKLAAQIRSRYSIPVREIDLKDKSAWLQLFTTELNHNFIKVIQKSADKLLEEWSTIIQDKRKPSVLIEDPNCEDFIATAALFAWSNCYNFHIETQTTYDDPMDEFWEAEEQRILEEQYPEDEFDDFY